MSNPLEDYDTPLNLFDINDQPVTWKRKLLFWFVITPMLVVTYIFFFKPWLKSRKRKQKITEKLRYFNPVIKEGLFWDKITWIGREQPLTDQELDNLCDHERR